jgi:hypothetical protein
MTWLVHRRHRTTEWREFASSGAGAPVTFGFFQIAREDAIVVEFLLSIPLAIAAIGAAFVIKMAIVGAFAMVVEYYSEEKWARSYRIEFGSDDSRSDLRFVTKDAAYKYLQNLNKGRLWNDPDAVVAPVFASKDQPNYIPNPINLPA